MEVVVAASQVRIATIALPPMPQSRIASAAAFALEDQLAGPNTTHELAVSPQSQDGRVRVAIAARSLIDAIAHEWPNATRIVAECDLARRRRLAMVLARHRRTGLRAASRWQRLSSGSAVRRSASCRRSSRSRCSRRAAPVAGLRVRVDAPVAPASAASLFARWQRTTGVEFIRGTPWEWEAVELQGVRRRRSISSRSSASAKASPERSPASVCAAMLLAAAALTLPRRRKLDRVGVAALRGVARRARVDGAGDRCRCSA
jgi:hypothetical protein